MSPKPVKPKKVSMSPRLPLRVSAERTQAAGDKADRISKIQEEMRSGTGFGIEEMTEMDQVEGLIEVLTIFTLRPALVLVEAAFRDLGPRSMVYFVTQGYVVVEPDAPIFGEAGRMNDNYVPDLRNNLAAVIDELIRSGKIVGARADIGRAGIGVGVLAFLYPATWGVLQLWTGALSDRIGRKRLIAFGMLLQGAALLAMLLVHDFAGWITTGIALGIGTAMVYPTLLAAIGDVAHPTWRASSVGVYRLWRDLGYVAGALLAGVVADLFGVAAAIETVGILTILSGLLVALRFEEHHNRGGAS